MDTLFFVASHFPQVLPDVVAEERRERRHEAGDENEDTSKSSQRMELFFFTRVALDTFPIETNVDVGQRIEVLRQRTNDSVQVISE